MEFGYWCFFKFYNIKIKELTFYVINIMAISYRYVNSLKLDSIYF